MTFAELVAAEIAKARAKHRGVHSPHEGYAVIQEELDEFWDLVKSQTPSGYEMLLELVQTAAMCQRTAEDTQLQEHFGALLADQRYSPVPPDAPLDEAVLQVHHAGLEAAAESVAQDFRIFTERGVRITDARIAANAIVAYLRGSGVSEEPQK